MSHYRHPEERAESHAGASGSPGGASRRDRPSAAGLPRGTAMSLVWFEPELDERQADAPADDTIDRCSSSR